MSNSLSWTDLNRQGRRDNAEAQAQARMQLDSVREMVAAMECDYDRLQDLRESVRPYVVGDNMPGYMPDATPDAFADADDARAALAETMRRDADDADDCTEGSDDCTEGSRVAAMLREIADRLDQFGAVGADAEFGQTLGNRHYFISFDPSPTAGLSDDEADELAELIAAAGDCEDADDARQRIQDDALSVELRSDWRSLDDSENEPTEYRIVLCTGGPHVEIVGELRSGEPRSARLLYQDWGTPKTELRISGDDRDALTAYASVFYFGE